MKLTRFEKAAFAAIVLLAAWYASPSEEEKHRALRLNLPIETPNGVYLSWCGGQSGTSYSIYQRKHIAGADWERIAFGLTGTAGQYYHQEFTLDKDCDYRIQADPQ